MYNKTKYQYDCLRYTLEKFVGNSSMQILTCTLSILALFVATVYFRIAKHKISTRAFEEAAAYRANTIGP